MRNFLQTRELDAKRANTYIDRDPSFFVELSEYRYIIQLHDLANHVLTAGDRIKILLVAGPSASSKTTTAHKLRDELAACGLNARIMSIDDFFLGLEHLPILPDGSYDMETIDGVDVPLARKCLRELMEKGRAAFPTFDFIKQRRGDKEHIIELGNDGILIIEGTHALNPVFIEGLPEEAIFRVYAGVMTGYVLDGEEIFSPRDIRLARRMVRDQLFRGWSAEKTLAQWSSVCAGEELFIDPYKRLADGVIDSALDYEPAVLHNFLFPMLEEISECSPYAKYVRGFKERYGHFHALSPGLIPEESILHEFVG